MNKLLIGRIDKADFPSFGLHEVPVKIDTGAYSCCIHCDTIEEKDGKLFVRFFEWQNMPAKEFVFETFDLKLVKSSNGQNQERYIIQSDIRLFGHVYSTNFSLSTRQEMKYPVLLGRKLLNKNFVVDTSKTNLSWKSENQ